MGFEEAFQAADLAVRALRSDGLKDIERVVLEGSWNRQTYQTIASEAGYTEGYLSRDVGPALWALLSDALGMQVKKTNFRTAIERWSKENRTSSIVSSASVSPASVAPNPEFSVDVVFSDAVPPDVDPLPFNLSDFRGREPALAELTEWIIRDRGRLLCLSGIPGVGKTWFALKLAEQVRSHFQRCVYRDLRDCPLPVELVTDLLSQIDACEEADTSLQGGLDRLLRLLTQRRCLIILDSTEHLCCRALAGTYEPNFDGYRSLLAALASRDHQSCVLWVGRELPRAAVPMAGSSCRFLALSGLAQDELSTLAFWPEELQATAADWQYLSTHYGGLPALISQEIAPRLSSFGHNLAACIDALQRDNRFLQAYVDAWLAALAEIEWHILTYMMISQRPVSLNELSAYLGQAIPLSAIESLCDGGICLATINGEPRWELALPDLLGPYLRDRLLAMFQAADEMQQVDLLHRYPLIQTDAPEVVRQWQRRCLLEPVAATLDVSFPHSLDKQLLLQRAMQRSLELTQSATTSGYSAGNLMNLAQYWHVSLVDFEFQGLQLRGADLQSDLFQGVSFAGADLSDTLLAKPLGQCPVIAMNPAQEQVAVGDQDGRLLLWDIQDGRLQRAMLGIGDAIRAIAFSPDGATVAEGRQDGAVRLWDLRSEYGPELFAHTATGALTRLVFSPDKRLLAGGGDDGTLYIWRLASGEEIQRFQAHEDSIIAIALSPCSRRLITCGHDCAAIEWDLQTAKPLHRFQGRLTNSLGTVAYLPAATEPGFHSVVVGRDEGKLIIWDIPSARPLRIMNESCDLFMALALSPDGRYLAVSDVSKKISVWDVETRSRLYRVAESSAPAESLIFSPNSKDLMTGCDYTVQRWEVRSGQCLRIWRSDRHPANRLTLATRPLQLLSSHVDQTLRCWQFSDLRQCWLPQERLQVPDDGLISSIATSLEGAHRAIGTEAGNIYVWQRDQQVWLNWSLRLPATITELAFSSNGMLLAAGDATGNVALWDLANRIFRWQKKQGHDDRVTALAFSLDNQLLFSGSRDRSIRSWNIQGSPHMTLTGHRRRVHTLCLSTDGKTLYSGSYDGTVRSWNLDNRTCNQQWQKGDQYVHQVTLDEQQRPIAIISDTQTLEVWDLQTDVCRSKLTAQEVSVWHVSASPDGTTLVCADQNGDIRIWELASGEFQGQLRVDRPYEGMQIGGCLGLTDSEQQMLYSLGATDY